MSTIQSLRSEVSTFRNLIARQSVSPVTVGYFFDEILDLLQSLQSDTSGYHTEINNMIQTLEPMSKKTYCDASGYILDRWLNSDVLTTGRLKAQVPDLVYSSQLDAAVGDMRADTWAAMFLAANISTAKFPEISIPGSAGDLRVNGYYPGTNGPKPYYINGIWLSTSEMLKVVFDRYIPFSGGVQCSALTNMINAKTSDSSLSLDYACVNNGLSKVITLGRSWKDSIRPASMKRAFDGCPELQAVAGEIDMSVIPSEWATNNLFRSCPNLWQFHLANIPDAIETLDLSGCSEAITMPFLYADDKPAISSLKYLCNNFKRDITRTKKLNIKLSVNTFADIADDLLYSVAGINWQY
ncbi:MAG: hypothetical protein K2M31_07870 [Muribaculaceae bacterium]|nr:hypothetical protein [Muribaculaceae bacterium]